MSNSTDTRGYSEITHSISSLIEGGWKTAVGYINSTFTVTYWLVRKQIVEYVQKEKE